MKQLILDLAILAGLFAAIAYAIGQAAAVNERFERERDGDH